MHSLITNSIYNIITDKLHVQKIKQIENRLLWAAITY